MAAPNLSQEEQMILDQFVAVSDWHGDMNQAVTLLRMCDWNVELALSRFFDQGMPVFRNQEPQDIGGDDSVLGDQFLDNLLQRGLASESGPLAAPRIREINNNDFIASSWLSSIFTVILLPFSMVGRVVSGISFALSGLAPLLPYSLRNSITRYSRPINSTRIAILSFLGLYGGSSSTQSQIFSENASRDRALRFIHRVENYGVIGDENPDTQLGFFEGGYNQALDQAKREYKYLLVILLSFNHDDTQEFVTKTLLSPVFKEFIKNNSGNLIVWGGDVENSEGYQVANGLLVTRLPMVGLIGLQQGASSTTTTRQGASTGMALLRRFQGMLSDPATIVDECTAIIIQHSEATNTLRQQELEREQEREMRRQQDAAYEASLATDRARRLAQEEAKRQEQDKIQQQQQQEELEKEWIAWRASQILPEPSTTSGGGEKRNYARVSIRTLNGDRIVRLFRSDTPIEEIYAVVECANSLGSSNLPPPSSSSSLSKPPGYQHQYKFHLVSPMPRTVIALSQQLIKDEPHLFPSGNLIVEPLDDDDDDD